MRSSVLAAACLAALCLTACNSQLLKEMGDIQTKACECKDQKCGDEVMDRFIKLIDNNKNAVGTDKEAQAFEGLATATINCLQDKVSDDKIDKFNEVIASIEE